MPDGAAGILDNVEVQALGRILIVEDDFIVREIMSAQLRQRGFEVVETWDVSNAVTQFAMERFDAAIIDVNLPDGSGFDLIKSLKAIEDCGIVLLTSRDSVDDRVLGLESGGDDYLVKPVDPRELAARLNAVLRRYRRASDRTALVFRFAGWKLDLVGRELMDPTGRRVHLTPSEFDLFAALVQADGRALSRRALLDTIAPDDLESQERTIDVMICRVRTKLAQASAAPPAIMTKRGEGYVFKAPR